MCSPKRGQVSCGSGAKRAKELEADERKLHADLPPHLQHILKGKRLLLLKEVLEDLQYPDQSLVDEIASGFYASWLDDGVQCFPEGNNEA